ncbi:glycosyltransferase [Georgenia sp. AZ-5]|uniref:glycosyltransferase family 2 protein n=1 Tax=Georgenia sp. AZ-5 TaxID=3367526 RepID=UPI003754A8AA
MTIPDTRTRIGRLPADRKARPAGPERLASPLVRLSTSQITDALARLPMSASPSGRWTLVVLSFQEEGPLGSIARPTAQLTHGVAAAFTHHVPGARLVGADVRDQLVLVVPRAGRSATYHALNRVAEDLAARVHQVASPREGSRAPVHVTPHVGYTALSRTSPRTSLAQAVLAARRGAERRDTEPTFASDHLSAADEAAVLGDVGHEGDEPAGGGHAAPPSRSVRSGAGTSVSRGTREGASLWGQLALTLAAGVGVPFVVYAAAARWGLDLTAVVYPLVVVALALTSTAIIAESMLAVSSAPPPPSAGSYPPASAVIAAYLPNEAGTIVETVRAVQRQDYPGRFQIVLAYNSPSPLPVERVLERMAAQDERLVLLRVPGSTSKAQNVNAALDVVDGEIVGVFDADHHPAPGAFARAWHWLANGYDVVQGHCVVRNGGQSWVARTVAVEFESIYSVSHPGRARMHGFAIFGGSNGYWRTPVLRTVRMRKRMLTEDIDSSMRAVLAGYRIASDRALLSYELAPTTVPHLIAQRLRWAQGWSQVSARWLGSGTRSRRLTVRQRLGMAHLLGWREAYPWISLQVVPIVGYAVLAGGVHSWFISLFAASTLLTVGIGPLQALMAYRLAEPSVRAHPRWFWTYVLLSPLYTEFKAALTRIAHVKQLLGEHVWRVTPRTAAVPPSSSAAPAGTQATGARIAVSPSPTPSTTRA